MTRRRRGLLLRLKIFVVVLLILASVVPSALTIVSQNRLLLDNLRGKAAATANTVAIAASDALAAGDEDSLLRVVATLVHEDPQVSSALIADAAGKVLARHKRDDGGTAPEVIGPPPEVTTICEVALEGGTPALCVTAPILVSGEPRGLFQAEIPLSLLEREMMAAVVRVLVIGILFLFVGAVGSARFVATIAHPIERLASLAAEVARGNFQVHCGFRSRDELGVLGDAFDHMTSQLSLAMARLRDYSSSLEAQTKDLAAARDAALESVRVKSRFVANMSHETRTPLSGVIGMTDILLETELTPEQKDFAETIRGSAQAMLAIVNDILDFSRLEAGKLKLESTDFDLRGLTDDLGKLLAGQARAKGLALTFLLPDVFPVLLKGDPGRLRQVFLNLLGNAIKFTDRGEVAVRVFRDAETHGDIALRVEVSDTGVGIPPEAQARLFQAFSQVDDSAARKRGGAGLGLAISRQLVELMGGRIGVSSEPGNGSTFWFTLSLEKSAAGTPQPRKGPEGAAGAGPSPLQVGGAEPEGREATAADRSPALGSVHVLVAEDNAVNQRIAVKLLGKLGCRVDVAANGREAVEKSAATSYDIVFMDCQMPELDGFQATAEIRRSQGGNRVPIVALTANAMPEDRQRCLAAGMDDYLPKPVKLEDLRAAMERHAAGR